MRKSEDSFQDSLFTVAFRQGFPVLAVCAIQGSL